jgi:hypothetical protein
MMAEKRNGSEHARLVVLLSILGIVVVVVAVMMLRGGGLTEGSAASEVLEYESHKLRALELARLDEDGRDGTGGQRNPFTYGAAPTPTPRPVTPRPTVNRTPPTPRPTPTPRMAMGADGILKPPPPPFDREYIGFFGPLRLQVAAFRDKNRDPDSREVEVATTGEVLDDIFIVREIGLETVVIGFVGYDRSEDIRVPLAEK